MSDTVICKYTDAARKIGKLPKDWHGWIFETVKGGLLVTGAVCPPITRGPNKGEPNYRKADQDTKCIVVIPEKILRTL